VPKAAPEAGATVPDGETDDKSTEQAKPQTPLSVGTLEDLHGLALVCAKFLLEHNAEPDAVDLLEELEIIDRIVTLVDANTYSRVAAYMIA
jgi:26S proteasome regulatory subunit N1